MKNNQGSCCTAPTVGTSLIREIEQAVNSASANIEREEVPTRAGLSSDGVDYAHDQTKGLAKGIPERSEIRTCTERRIIQARMAISPQKGN